MVLHTVVPSKPGEEIPSFKPTVPTTQPRAVATTPPPVASEPAQTAEERAHDKLQLAELNIHNGLKDRAKETLREIITFYPDTKAAKDARAKLAEMSK